MATPRGGSVLFPQNNPLKLHLHQGLQYQETNCSGIITIRFQQNLSKLKPIVVLTMKDKTHLS